MCKHERYRALICRAFGNESMERQVRDMYARYVRERAEGIRANSDASIGWRSVVRWELDRHERDLGT